MTSEPSEVRLLYFAVYDDMMVMSFFVDQVRSDDTYAVVRLANVPALKLLKVPARDIAGAQIVGGGRGVQFPNYSGPFFANGDLILSADEIYRAAVTIPDKRRQRERIMREHQTSRSW